MVRTRKRKIKIKHMIVMAVVVAIVIAAIIILEFTAFGYRMTVQYRNFTEVQTNVYVENSLLENTEEVIEIVDAAKNRVSDFWGDIISSPIMIISNDEETVSRLGGDHDTVTLALFRVFSYISISDEYLNVDIVAHELTHAELHARLCKRKFKPAASMVPTWFDEGTATQNDYRNQYSEETWLEETNNGLNIIELYEMDTPEKFYAGEIEDKRFRYMLCRHEVKSWIDINGFDRFVDLITRVNAGEKFNELYYHTEGV